MRILVTFAVMVLCATGFAQEPDAEIAHHIESIKAIDNHSHVIAADPADKGFDQLRCEMLPDSGIGAASQRYPNPDWMNAIHALYGFTPKDGSDAEMKRVDDARAAEMQHHGDQRWVLDKAGIGTVLANRLDLTPEMKAPRVLWVPYEDALLFPLNNTGEKSVNPDRKALFEMAEHLQTHYLELAGLKKLPPTLDQYVKQVLVPTLERQRKGGAVALKFEAAYLRALDFEPVLPYQAQQVYAKHVNGSIAQPADYKLLQDYLFKQIALEAGKLGMAVHIHTGSGCGAFFNDPGADAVLLSPMLNDPDLRKTNFVLLHGNWTQERKVIGLILKPNVYVDTSLIEYFLTPREYAEILKSWLEQMPERVLFGTDASPGGPGQNWPETTLWGAAKFRRSLAIALTEMVREGSIDKQRAKEIADLVLRENAAKLYAVK
ncbi:amidohydrolase 2 [Candidatus Koribacter versatilis Ellin345]|uniref:Amidohydrolase 2 n=1 Tax=Koribacter versatilis (strain Ellin345) TaxID=204669 RepID=Q1IT09_KORVE|nr:amidohydrolase family protein [Candidatus Koribacter versatilis]ABF39991.1 amidohydrolase 2 [Candidatus Koribacter versatilis Ellin345]